MSAKVSILEAARLRRMPKERLTLGPARTHPRDEKLKPLWQEAIFAVHIQDERMTEEEREVIAAIGRRLYGRRAVV